MSRYNLPKLSRYIPLWQRRIPAYPLYWKGNPQLRVFMPLFWMKLLNGEGKHPPGQVLFEIHPQMTKYDVKNYLEKIYNVPVLTVYMETQKGKARTDDRGGSIQPEDNKKLARVKLGNNATFEFPDFFAEKKSDHDRNAEEYTQMMEKDREKNLQEWQRRDLPSWFR